MLCRLIILEIVEYMSEFFKKLGQHVRGTKIYNINWMDCTMLKKCVHCQIPRSNFLGSSFLFWRCVLILITIFTDHYHFLGDTFHRQLQLFCYCACPDLPKWRKIGPLFEIRCHCSSLSSIYMHCCQEITINFSLFGTLGMHKYI